MVQLNALHINDARILADLLNNKRIWNYLRDSLPYPYTIEDARHFIENLENDKQVLNLAIRYQGKFCGVIGLKRGTDIHRKSAELGYWVGEPYWRKGIATQAIALMTNKAFKDLPIHRIFARVFANNPASVKALQHNGYRQEALLKQAVYKNGLFLDEYIFAKLKNSDEIL